MRTTMDGFSSAADGRFQAVERIGAGGMGSIYGAFDTWTRKAVALKMAHKQRGGTRGANEQLRHEAVAQCLVNNRHVCGIYELVYDEGHACLVLERLAGETLRVRLSKGPTRNAELLHVAIQTAQALEAIHAAGVVHQDVKPSNIFLTRTGVVKVLDFGVADAAGTRPAVVLGSSNYVSPERLMLKPADPRGDLFSLGVVLYEMATGVPPFQGETRSDTLQNVLDAKPVPIGDRVPDRPAELVALIHSLLARRAKDRCQSASDVVRRLRAIRRVNGVSGARSRQAAA